MLGSFVSDLVTRRTTSWFEERHPAGPTVTGIHPYPLEGESWFVHLSVSDEPPSVHALVRMRGMSITSIEVIHADGVICPACRVSTS